LTTIWTDPQIIYWTGILLDSYCQLIGKDLIDRNQSPNIQAEMLYQVPFVVVSHGIETDPVLNYGNQIALDLWEMDWTMFTQTLSRSTAEPANQAAREVMMAQVLRQGFVENYCGVRISSDGLRSSGRSFGILRIFKVNPAVRQQLLLVGNTYNFTYSEIHL
jgi:MEKHLA domain